MARMDSSANQATLRANYMGPAAEPKTFSHPIGALPPKPSVQQKTEYLATLRASVVRMQDEINAFLTAKMEEDNRNGHGKSVDDKKEEENYGEEVVDDDE